MEAYYPLIAVGFGVLVLAVSLRVLAWVFRFAITATVLVVGAGALFYYFQG